LKEEPYDLAHPLTGEIDENQNFVSNVRRGMNNYGWIQMYQPMEKLLKEKKLYGRLHTLANCRGDYEGCKDLEAEMIRLQKKAFNEVKKIEEEEAKMEANQKAIYIYLQFQSMTGKNKFMKSLRVSKCKRCCIKCQCKGETINHKYIGGEWP
jgi:hypothetical protein